MLNDSSRMPRLARSRLPASRTELLQRRVLPLAVYAKEVADGVDLTGTERLQRFGSVIMPIAVPLAPGETEQQYETQFVAWLAERKITIAELVRDANPNRERLARCPFAMQRVKEFNGKSLEERRRLTGEVEETETHGPVVDGSSDSSQKTFDPKALPRDVLNAKRVVSLDEFRKEVESGVFASLAHMTADEKLRRFGFPMIPIAVPLAPGETEEQYEARFVEWLQREKFMSLSELQNHHIITLERCLRLVFATKNRRGTERFVPPSAKRGRQHVIQRLCPLTGEWICSVCGYDRTHGRSMGSAKETPASARHMRYLKRYMELEHYRRDFKARRFSEYVLFTAAERVEHFGIPIVPIFVPLAPSETKELYEARFVDWLERDSNVTLHQARFHPNKAFERSQRMHFAALNGKGVVWYDSNRLYSERNDESCVSWKRSMVVKTEDEIKDAEDVEDGEIIEEPIEEDSPVDPRSLPREVRIAKSIVSLTEFQDDVKAGKVGRLKTMTRAESMRLYRSPLPPIPVPLAPGETERQYEEWWVKRNKRMTHEEIEAYEMGLLERRMRIDFAELNGRGIEWFDTRRARYDESNRKGEHRLVDQDSSESLKDRATRHPVPNEGHRHPEAKSVVDAKTKELLRVYNDMNEMIVLNEEVLEMECNQCNALSGSMDAHEAAVFQSENQELRVLIQDEYERRSLAVATLIHHIFRDRQQEIRAMIENPEATNNLDEQRAVHKRCAGLASDAAKNRAKLEELQAEVSHQKTDALSRQEREEATTRTTRAIERLGHEELKALEGLIHVDMRMRRTLETIMTN